jgi:competence protein ComEC
MTLRIKIKARFVITVLFLFFYSFITGLQSSVVRATIMGIIFLLSFIVKREYHVYNSLALAAMIILAIWPWQILDVGFQLSFISVLSIVYISPKILAIFPKFKNRILSLITASFVVSLAAFLGTAPLVAYYFGMVSLISMIANIFIVFLANFILIGGFIYLAISFCVPALLKWLALSLEFLTGILIYIALTFKNIPFSYFYVERFPVILLFFYYVLIIAFFSRFTALALGKRFPK